MLTDSTSSSLGIPPLFCPSSIHFRFSHQPSKDRVLPLFCICTAWSTLESPAVTEVPSATVIKVNKSVTRRDSCCHLKRFSFGAGFSEIRIDSKADFLLLLPVRGYIKIKTQTLDCIESCENQNSIALQCLWTLFLMLRQT